MSDSNGFTNKEMLVIVMSDVKQLQNDVAEIKASIQGSSGFEERIRGLEKWKWSFPPTLITALAALIIPFL